VTVSSTSSVSEAYEGYVSDSVSMILLDNDLAIVTVSEVNITTMEGDSGTLFTVSLSSSPVDPVEITFASDAEGNYRFQPSLLTFTGDTWNIPRQVTFLAPDDKVIEGRRTYTETPMITTSDAAYSSVSVPDLSLIVDDDECFNITSYSPSLSASIGGAVITITFADDVSFLEEGDSSINELPTFFCWFRDILETVAPVQASVNGENSISCRVPRCAEGFGQVCEDTEFLIISNGQQTTPTNWRYYGKMFFQPVSN